MASVTCIARQDVALVKRDVRLLQTHWPTRRFGHTLGKRAVAIYLTRPAWFYLTTFDAATRFALLHGVKAKRCAVVTRGRRTGRAETRCVFRATDVTLHG